MTLCSCKWQLCSGLGLVTCDIKNDRREGHTECGIPLSVIYKCEVFLINCNFNVKKWKIIF